MSDSTTGPVWDDEEYPWVNAEVNSNSKVGVAARCVVMWGTDVHAEGKDPATYESALNAIWDLADTITELIAERDQLLKELKTEKLMHNMVSRAAKRNAVDRDKAIAERDALRQMLSEIGGQDDEK